VPAADVLWTEFGSRALVEIEGDDFAAEMAQHLLGGKNVLIDASARLGCVCSGAAPGTPAKNARQNVVALEPPRSTIPIVDEQAPIELDLAVPAAPRAPIDVVAVPPGSMPIASTFNTPPRGFEPSSLGHRISPVRGFAPVPDPRQSRGSNPVTPISSRPVVGPMPVVRDPEGRALPRAYISRRRPSPRATPTVRPPTTGQAPAVIPQLPTIPQRLAEPQSERPESQGSFDASVDVQDAVITSAQEPFDHPFQNIPLHYVVLILVAVAVTIVASSAIAIIAGRSLNRPAATAPATTP
jgi:hypothetical protein